MKRIPPAFVLLFLAPAIGGLLSGSQLTRFHSLIFHRDPQLRTFLVDVGETEDFLQFTKSAPGFSFQVNCRIEGFSHAGFVMIGTRTERTSAEGAHLNLEHGGSNYEPISALRLASPIIRW
jgi:hypothetical protein